jgi:YD repeat-containing protein
VTRYGASDAEAETQWTYDPSSGLCTAKTYADNSVVAYTHTPDGKPLRTTWARGAWCESSFNADGLLTATTYSGGTPAVALAYDAFQRLAAASNAVAQYAYANDKLGAVTNETATIGTNTHTLVRVYDGFHRLALLTAAGGAVNYTYDVDGRFSTVSNTAFTATYVHTPDGLDAGWAVACTNGTTISRMLTRDTYRRSLVTAIANCVNDVPVNPLTFSFDAINRVVSRNDDSFDYNARSEITSATIQPSSTNRYEYDGIGNNLWTTVNRLPEWLTGSDFDVKIDWQDNRTEVREIK